MTNIYTQMADKVAADLRAEGCTKSVTITAQNRASQPLWARQELAGRMFRLRDDLNRLPSEDNLSYEQSMNTAIMYASDALGLIVARGELRTPKIIGYRIMSYHTQLDDLDRDLPGLLALLGTGQGKDVSKVQALLADSIQNMTLAAKELAL